MTRIRRDDPDRVVFVHLSGTRETVGQRLTTRTDHFMPASLLDSQLATPIARAIAAKTGVVDSIQFTKSQDTGRTKDVRGDIPTAIDPFIGYSFIFSKSLGTRTSIDYKATIDKVQDRADLSEIFALAR